jgi:hypothetical protein
LHGLLIDNEIIFLLEFSDFFPVSVLEDFSPDLWKLKLFEFDILYLIDDDV